MMKRFTLHINSITVFIYTYITIRVSICLIIYYAQSKRLDFHKKFKMSKTHTLSKKSYNFYNSKN